MYEYKHNYHLFLALLLALFIALCGMMLITEAKAEELPVEPVPSITVDALYRVISGAMAKSDAPFDLQIVECIRLDIDTDSLPEQVTLIDAEIVFPALPKKLKSVLLYDGKHVLAAQWHWTDENAIYIAFERAEIEKMDQAQPLYLFLIALR